MRGLFLGVLLCAAGALAQSSKEGKTDGPQTGSMPTPADRRSTSESSERGSMGSTAGGEERTAVPGAGIESGDANGMAGGRTDEGPRGGTGIRGPVSHERSRAKRHDQARGRNPKGSFLRPADSPPDMNRDPKAKGSGAPQLPVDEQPQAQGRAIARHPSRASPTPKGSPGAAAAQGSAGKSSQAQKKEETDRH